MEKLLISIIVFCSGISFIYVVEIYSYPIPEQKLVSASVIKKNVDNFQPKGNFRYKELMFDYRSNEPSRYDLELFLKVHPEVTTVIRLNGEGKDSDGLRISTERKICESQGVKFIYSPMTKNYKQWAESLMPIMLKETVLIHCHHGYDRTGYPFAYKLMKYHGYTFNQVRKINGWDKYDTNSKQFYPVLKELDKK